MRVALGPASVDTELARVFRAHTAQSPVTSTVASSNCDNMRALADGSHLANVATRLHFPGPTRSRAPPTPTGTAASAVIPLRSNAPTSQHTNNNARSRA